VNATGAAGTVELDSVPRQELGVDMAVNAGLSPGHHTLQFVLHCSGTFAEATIDIGQPAGVVPPTTGPPSTSSTAGLTPAATPPPVTQPTAATRVAEMAFSTPSAPTVGPRSSVAAAGATVVPSPDDATVFYDPYPVGDPGRARNLLVVIALICVLGVSTAIIRVIVAQRTDRVIRGR
jgi:hypothetical protein